MLINALKRKIRELNWEKNPMEKWRRNSWIGVNFDVTPVIPVTVSETMSLIYTQRDYCFYR